MTEDEFVRHAMRTMRLFQQNQPSDQDFLEIRLKEDQPNDIFVQLAQKREEMLESANQMLELWHCIPEGRA